MKMWILDCGAMTADLTFLLLKRGRTLKLRSQRKDDPGTPWYRVSSHCVLIETDDGTRLLWDTGCPRDWEDRWAAPGTVETFPYDDVAEHEFLDSRLAQLGVGVTDIDIVVASHLHLDHVGNAKLFTGGSTRFVTSAAELEYAMAIPGEWQGPYIKSDYADLPWETVAEDHEILPGVTLLQVPGHSAGCLAMKVDLPNDGTMIFTSDSINMTDS
jgi:N-acyl homoserine lactone hydrolase